MFLLIPTGLALSQPGPGQGQWRQAEPIGSIKGIVYDIKDGEPLPYASISLYRRRDSTRVDGAIASEDGHFLIEKVSFGRFYLEVKFLGYEKKMIPRILILPENYEINVGEIHLYEAAQHLEAIEVTAERSPVEYKIDRKVIHIDGDLHTHGESVSRALENTPSITVDIDGNVQLRGSTNFTVLIDGKPSPLDGSDALRQIPASAVKNVEIITSPSAKFDPDGLAGIINVITKKNALDGFSGIINASVGTNDKYRGDLLMNYKTNDISFYLGRDFNDINREGTLDRMMISGLSDTTRYITSNGEGVHVNNGNTLKGGITYNLNRRNSLSLEGNFGHKGRSRSITDNFHEYTVPFNNNSYYISDSQDEHNADYYNLTLSYTRLFNKEDNHNLRSYLYYESRSGKSGNSQERLTTDAGWNNTDEVTSHIYTRETHNPDKWRFQVDYTQPLFKNGKLETGYQVRYTKKHNGYEFNEWDFDNDSWIDNPEYSNKLDFKRNIQALYAVIGNEWDKFSLQAGLRTEYTYRIIEHQLSEVPARIDRIDLFPGVHFSRKIGNKDQVLASYSRRINRPKGFVLNPFPNYMDQNNMRIGNPELEPEYVDSYEVSYQKGIGKSSFISLEGYYRMAKNKITRIVNVNEDGLRTHTMDNLNKEGSIGAELTFNYRVKKWFGFNLGSNYYNYTLEGSIADSDVAASSNNFDARLNTNFRFTPTTRFQLQGFYQGPSVSAQGHRDAFFMTSAAISQELFDKKMTATLRIRDIFGTGSFRFVNEGSRFYDEFDFRRESQVVVLSVSYRINNFKRQNRNRNPDEAETDDMIMNY